MPNIPQPDHTIASKFNDLHRRVRALESGNMLEGGATIRKGGFTAIDPNTGHRVVFFGLGGFNDDSDRMQMETLFYRANDGTLALSISDFGETPGHTYDQSISLWDRNARIIVSDDTVSGHGLGTPHLGSSGTLVNTNEATWPATTNTTFTTIANGYMEIQNPLLNFYIECAADSGITANYQLLINSTLCATGPTVTSGTSTTWAPGKTALPSGVTVGNVYLVELQAKSSAGTGSARAQVLNIGGWQS